jgi:predicted ester cyclase
MSTTQNKAVLARILDAFNEHNLEKLDQWADEFCTADYVYHHPDFTDLPPGPAGFKQFIRRVLADMPDAHQTIEDMVAEGDKVASRWTVRGTEVSQQKTVTLTILNICRFVGGKIAERWELGHQLD